MYDLPRSIQTPALLKALRLSYGVAASRSNAARAVALAPSIQQTHPGIYLVGRSTVSLWRVACTCSAARQRARSGQPWQPCAHFLALYLAGEWSPIFNPVACLEKAGKQEPLMVGWVCSLATTRGRFRFVDAYADGWIELAPLAGGPSTLATLADVRQLCPIWESE